MIVSALIPDYRSKRPAEAFGTKNPTVFFVQLWLFDEW